MSVLNGGIFSNPRGKTAGIVFGAARTRTGKKVTARQLVAPSNPNTAGQQTQRGKFSEAVAIVRLIGASVYQTDWNRAIGQLPGFQSLESVFLNSLDSSFNVTTIPPVNLGSLYNGGLQVVGQGVAPGDLDIEWATGNGVNGTANDIAVCLIVQTAPGSNPLERSVKVDTSGVRSDVAINVSGLLANENYSVLMYFQGQGTADGLLSPTSFAQGTSHA